MTRGTQTVLSRTALSTAGMAVQGIARLAYTLAIGRLAGEAQLADTSALLSLAVWLSLVLPAGLGVAASRYLPSPETAGPAVSWLGRWFWASSLPLAIIAAPAAYWIVGDLASALGCSLLVFCYSAYVYTRGCLMGEDRILRSAVADLVSSLIAITALIAVLLGGAHWALLLPLAVGYGVFALASWPRTTPRPASAQERALMLRFLRDAVLSGLATGGLLPATMVFVRAFDEPLEAGLFAAALSLATPASLLSQAINQVMIPHFARLQHDPRAMRESQRKLLFVTFALFLVLFGALIALAPWILSLFYGDRYAGGGPAMRGLLAVVFFISATCVPSAYLMAAGRQRLFASIWLTAFVVGTVGMAIAAPQLGMWGALLGFAIGGGGGSIAVIVTGLVVRPGQDAREAATKTGNVDVATGGDTTPTPGERGPRNATAAEQSAGEREQ